MIWNAHVSGSEGLTELQKLKAENIKLKSQYLQCQVSVAQNQLGIEKSQFELEVKRSLGARDEEVFDWNTLTFTTFKSADK